MSTNIKLMDLPREILHMILKEHFSRSVFNIAWDKATGDSDDDDDDDEEEEAEKDGDSTS